MKKLTLSKMQALQRISRQSIAGCRQWVVLGVKGMMNAGGDFGVKVMKLYIADPVGCGGPFYNLW
jgi:hypothetical protein